MSATPSGLPTGKYYPRKWRVIVTGTEGSTPIFDSLSYDPNSGIINETRRNNVNNALDLSNLRCTFKVEQNYAQVQQFGEVTIYNLNRDTETAIFKNAQQVIIEAGYENGPYGIIYIGNVYQPIRAKEDATTHYIKLRCIDSDAALYLGFCNFSLSAGQTAKAIAEEVCRSSSVPFALKSDDLSEQKTSRGKVIFGQPRDVLRSIAINNQASFYFKNGVGHISKVQRQPQSDIVVKLNAESGMIGLPKQVNYGVQVRSLINPQIQINNFIHLNNQDIILADVEFGGPLPYWVPDLDGYYRVINITANGDTRGNDWYYDIECLTQQGYLPAMLTDKYQSGF